MKLGLATNGSILTLPPDIVGRHVYVLGEGKSTLLANCALSLIEDRGLLFIDRYGDTAAAIADRINKKTIYWEPGRYPIGFNPLSVKDTSEKIKVNTTERMTKSLLHALASVSKKSRNFYDEMEETILRNGIRLLIDNAKGLSDIERCLKDEKYRRYLVGSSPATKAFWKTYDNWEEKDRTQYTLSLFNKLSLLDTLEETFNGDTLDLQEIVDERQILLLDLSGLSDQEARILGSLLLTTVIGLTSTAPFFAIVDECQLFINPSTPEALKPGNLGLLLANRYETQLQPELLDAILGNCATVISFCLGADVKRIGARLDLPEPNELRRLFDGRAIVHTKRVEGRGDLRYGVPYRTQIETFPLPPSLGRLKAIRRLTKATYGR